MRLLELYHKHIAAAILPDGTTVGAGLRAQGTDPIRGEQEEPSILGNTANRISRAESLRASGNEAVGESPDLAASFGGNADNLVVPCRGKRALVAPCGGQERHTVTCVYVIPRLMLVKWRGDMRGQVADEGRAGSYI